MRKNDGVYTDSKNAKYQHGNAFGSPDCESLPKSCERCPKLSEPSESSKKIPQDSNVATLPSQVKMLILGNSFL